MSTSKIRMTAVANSFTLLVSALPMALFVGIVMLAFRARLALGHWPRPHGPDPKELPFSSHFGLLDSMVWPTVGTIFVIPILAFLIPKLVSLPVQKKSLILFCFGWGLIFAGTIVPPFDFVMWFLD